MLSKYSFIRKIALSLTLTVLAVSAKTLNDQEQEFYTTPTGSYLHAAFPDLKPEDAVKAGIDAVVTKHQNLITNFDYVHKDQEIEKLYKVISPLLQKEIDLRDTHDIFYHGHSNEIALYLDVLKDFSEITRIKDLEKAHPLRLKDKTPIKNVNHFLDQFMDEYKKEAAQKGVDPFDPKRNSGFTFAPDLTDFARQHTICVNPSLFSNTDNAFESTFYYFVNSFNIGNPNEALIEKLLLSTGLATQDTVKNQIDAYKQIFAKRMQQLGGGLLQIAMKKKIVDQNGYGSWAKGVPYYMFRNNGKFATRGGNKRTIPALTKHTRSLVRPKLSDMLNLYKRNIKGFAKRYSVEKPNFEHADRFQVRLFVNPEVFSNSELVEITRVYRSEFAESDMQEYQTKRKELMNNSFTQAIAAQALTSKFFDYDFPLGKVVKFMFNKTVQGAKDLFSVIRNSSAKVLHEVMSIIKAGLAKLATPVTWVLDKLNIVENMIKFKDKVVNFRDRTVDFVKKFLSPVIGKDAGAASQFLTQKPGVLTDIHGVAIPAHLQAKAVQIINAGHAVVVVGDRVGAVRRK